MTHSTIYWITRVDGLKDILTLMFFICMFALVVFLAVLAAAYMERCFDKHDENASDTEVMLRKAVLWALAAGLTLLAVNAFVPSTKELAAIYAIPQLTDDGRLRELGGKARQLAEGWLESAKPGSEDRADKTSDAAGMAEAAR